MKTLVINGSLKGNRSHSMMIAESFVKGMTNVCDTETEVIELGKVNIEHCTGCFCCWKVTPGQCAIRDDMDMIREKILESDVIIVSFPLYFFGLPSKLKALLDRLLPFKKPYNGRPATEENPVILDFRYDFSGKKLILVSTCAHASRDYVYDPVVSQFDLIFGKDKYTSIFCGQGEILELEQMKGIFGNYLKKVEKAGEEFGNNKELGKATLEQICAPIIPPRALEKMMTGYWEKFLHQ